MKLVFELQIKDLNVAAELQRQKQLVKELTAELKGVKEGTAQYDALVNEIAAANIQVNKLKESQKELNRAFKEAQVPKDSLAGLRLEYSRLVEQLAKFTKAERESTRGKAVIDRAAALKKEINSIEESVGRFTGSVGNYRIATEGLTGGFRQLFGVLSIGFGADQLVQEISKVSDAIAEVQKTTGLAEEQARELSDALRLRDTRTSLTDQLQIAAIGGQLGIANDQLKDFTESTDVLNVALGDQFGNVEILTREFAGLRNVLTDFKTDNAADDILKLGNAVNFLEAQGAATGTAIVDFASRIAGAGIPLGATTDKIIGLSTALAELNINPERGATAVQRLLVELAKAPEVFAQAIGEPSERFTKLVQEDIIGALTLVSKRVSESSTSNTAFAKTLDDLGIGAQGAIEVFGKLGGNTDLLNKRIKEARESLTNANSVTQEFQSKNNNAAAAVEKLKNSIVNLFTGNVAQDALEAFADTLNGLLQTLTNAPELTEKYKAEILALSAALVILKREQIGVALASVAQSRAWQVLTNATVRTEVVTKALALAQKALPLVAVAAAVYALVKAFDALVDTQDEAAENAERLADAQARITEEASKEIANSAQLIEVLKSETASKEEKRVAIDKLLEQYPTYFRGIDLEKATVSQLTEIQKGLNKEIIRGIAERQKAVGVNELLAKSASAVIRAQQIREGGFAALTPEEVQRTGRAPFGTEFEKQFVSAQGQIDAVRDILNLLGKDSEKFQKQATDLGASIDKAFDLKPDKERNISAAEQDLLDRQRQFAERGKTLEVTVKATGNTIDALEEKLKALRLELEKTEIGSTQFKILKDQILAVERQLNAARATAKAVDGAANKDSENRKKQVEDQIKRVTEIRQAIREFDASTIVNEFDKREIELENKRLEALEKADAQRLQVEEKIKANRGQRTAADVEELRLIDEQTASIKAAYDRQFDELAEQRAAAVLKQKQEIQSLSDEVLRISLDNAEQLAEIEQQLVSADFAKAESDLRGSLATRQKELNEAFTRGDLTKKQLDKQQIKEQEAFNLRILDLERERADQSVRIAEQLRDAKIAAAQAALAAELAEIEQSRAADVKGIQKQGLAQGTDPTVTAELIAQREKKALEQRTKAQQDYQQAVTDATQDATDAQIAGLDAVNEADRQVQEDKLARIEKEKEKRRELLDAALSAAQSIADAITQIEENRLQADTDEKIKALDEEYEKKKEAATGNAALLAKLDKEYATKKLAIEKQAAAERKKIAIKEAIIAGALAVVKALPNVFAAVAAAVAAAAQIAIISAQTFARGGQVKRLKPGIIAEQQNAPRTLEGDTVLVYAKPGEMFLNEQQQRKAVDLAGEDFFYKIGVPGISKRFRPGTPGFAGGGVVDFTPQIALPGPNDGERVIVVQTQAEFSDEQIDALAERVASRTGAATQSAVAAGLDDANRRTERENTLQTNREV